MNGPDRLRSLTLLAEGRDAVLASLQGLAEENASLRASPDRWSVLEILEHICLGEDLMFLALSTRLPLADSPRGPEREDAIIAGTTRREDKITAPDRMRPTGQFASLAHALAHFSAARARTIAYVESCDRDLRLYRAKHPTIGDISGQEFLFILALHPSRHALQIRETRDALKI